MNDRFRLGVVVCLGLLVMGCSSKDTMTKEDRILSEKMKIAMLGNKEEFIATMKRKTKLLAKAEKIYIQNGGTPSTEYNPYEAFIHNVRNSFQDNHTVKSKVNVYSYNPNKYYGKKPDEKKKFSDPDLQSMHEYNIKKWRRSHALEEGNTDAFLKESYRNERNKLKKLGKKFQGIPNKTPREKARINTLTMQTYFASGEFHKVIKVGKEAIEFFKTSPHDSDSLSRSYNFVTLAYLKLRLPNEALKIAKEHINISTKRTISNENLHVTYTMIGDIHKFLKNYNEGVVNYMKALEYASNKREYSETYQRISTCYLKLGQRNESSYYMNKAISARK